MEAFPEQVGSFFEAMELFHEMQLSGVTPNEFTLTGILAACANLVALDQGRWVHFYIKRAKIKMNERLLAGLIDMYAKCGELDSALKVFNEEEILKQTVWPWNAMLSGFAVHGKSKEAIDLFERMKSKHVAPNKVTFVSLLSACSHGSFLDEGKLYFKSMKDFYGIDPEIEHYGCMVDLFGRAGLLNEAEEFISLMPMLPDIVIWSALLAACRIHKDIERAEQIGRIIKELEPKQVGCQVLLANIYCGSGRWTGAKDLRNEIKISGTRKAPGCSSIELNGMFHQFLVGDRSHPETKQIYSFLDDMSIKLKNAGYEAEVGEVLLDIDEEDKETALSIHSEKLAIAFGLMNTPPGTAIRIMKNLRVCLDCHHATKLISKLYDREIIVRDRIRFHHFRGGLCSCKDFW
uniref:Pentatricopeptide repeat-containing protein At5g66520 n=1 Tax=Anthurium amnicola TaxID=1678845 RepID=A0A1D1XR66_9ARAE